MSTKFDKIGDKLGERACEPRQNTSRLVAYRGERGGMPMWPLNSVNGDVRWTDWM